MEGKSSECSSLAGRLLPKMTTEAAAVTPPCPFRELDADRVPHVVNFVDSQVNRLIL